MKYIVFVGDKNDGQGEREFIVLFDRSIDHDLQFESLHSLRDNDGPQWERCWVDPQPVSAGFVSPLTVLQSSTYACGYFLDI